MPAQLIAETLQLWRNAERLLDTIPPGDPDHETARLLVLQLREQYASLLESEELTAERLSSSRRTIELAALKLRELRA